MAFRAAMLQDSTCQHEAASAARTVFLVPTLYELRLARLSPQSEHEDRASLSCRGDQNQGADWKDAWHAAAGCVVVHCPMWLSRRAFSGKDPYPWRFSLRLVISITGSTEQLGSIEQDMLQHDPISGNTRNVNRAGDFSCRRLLKDIYW